MKYSGVGLYTRGGGGGWVGGLLPYKSERDAHQKTKIKLLVVVFVVFFFSLSIT